MGHCRHSRRQFFPLLVLVSFFSVLVHGSCKEAPAPVNQVDDSPVVQAELSKPEAAKPPEPARPQAPPRVGINGVDAGHECTEASSQCSRSTKVRASLEHAGLGWAHLMPKSKDHASAAGALLDEVDCLVLRGGADINPARFAEKSHPSISPISAERESFDFALVTEALERGMPLLGLCLGAQEINVVRGGNLIQDIPSEVDNELDHRQDHAIQTVPGTRMAEIYGETVSVHSNHHQSVDAMGEGLVVSARSSDGVIEAFEAADRSKSGWLVGVQYHPEFEVGTEHDKLFAAFASACQAYRAGQR